MEGSCGSKISDFVQRISYASLQPLKILAFLSPDHDTFSLFNIFDAKKLCISLLLYTFFKIYLNMLKINNWGDFPQKN